jgi:hypothetical protein
VERVGVALVATAHAEVPEGTAGHDVVVGQSEVCSWWDIAPR